ncbi:hypothetical protein AAG906_027206 [Vitis piasezkii]
MRNLQPRFARHLMGFPQTDFGSLVQALYGIEEGISRGLWADSSPSDSKGKKSGSGPRSSDTLLPLGQEGPTYLHPPPQRTASEAVRQFTQLGMPLSRAFQRLVEGRLIAPLPPRPPLLTYPRDSSHDTIVQRLRHAIQDLIDQGLVDLGPGVATDPLPTHDTRAFVGDEIFMMGWDGDKDPVSFSLTPDRIYGPPPVSPVYLQHVPPMTPFILFPEEYRPPHRDVQIVTRSGRVAQPPPVDRPFAGIAAREEVQREDDEILRQLRTTQARISIWSLLASSSTHRDALVRALGQIRVDTATTPEGLIHMLTADRATCIVFSDDDLPPKGSNHVRPLFIDVACLGRRCSLFYWTTARLNVRPLVLAIVLGFHQMILGLLHASLELMMGLEDSYRYTRYTCHEWVA